MLFAMLSATCLAFSSCTENGTKTEKKGKEYTSAFICPMNCTGSGGDAAGTCPVCKMDYVANKDHKEVDPSLELLKHLN